jgi:hypothetical protein
VEAFQGYRRLFALKDILQLSRLFPLMNTACLRWFFAAAAAVMGFTPQTSNVKK